MTSAFTVAVDSLAQLPGGTFRMGSDRHYPEEAPSRYVTVGPFAIGRWPVTNRQYRRFTDATGYRTVAERPLDPAAYPGAPPENLRPGSMVFTPTPGPVDLRHLSQWWRWQPGADWRHPEGPGSSIADREDHPVVHVAFEDAATYAAWAGAFLPTEAQWEYAARGGLDGAEFTWGDQPRPSGTIMANVWDGPDFPWRSTGESGWIGTSPVGAFPANGFGLFDMAGNVWEWTRDRWTADHRTATGSCCAPEETGSVPQRVIKGGSHLCADTYCRRYRPAARRPHPIDTGMSHIGFRCGWKAGVARG